jgi:hypothetical protein
MIARYAEIEKHFGDMRFDGNQKLYDQLRESVVELEDIEQILDQVNNG